MRIELHRGKSALFPVPRNMGFLNAEGNELAGFASQDAGRAVLVDITHTRYLLMLTQQKSFIEHGGSATFPEAIRYTSATATVHSSILREIGDLFRKGAISSLAHKRALTGFQTLYETRKPLPAHTDLYLDDDGWLRVLWNSGPRSLELVFPGSVTDPPYAFFSEDRNYKVTYRLYVPEFSRLLDWLANPAVPFPLG